MRRDTGGPRCERRPPRLLIILSLVIAASAVVPSPHAGGNGAAEAVQLEPFKTTRFTVSMPKGWKITSDAANAMIVAQQDPTRKDAAALVLTVQANGTNATEDQLLDVVAGQVAKNLKVSRREAIQGGGHMLIADGATADNIKVRVGAIALTGGGEAIVCGLVSKVDDFDPLGGIELVGNVMGSIKMAQAAPAQPPSNAANSGGGKLDAPPSRPLTLADIAGVWNKDDGSIKSYVNTSTGGYAGYHATTTSARYTITTSGAITDEFSGYSGGTGGGVFASETTTGTVAITPGGVLEIAFKGQSFKTRYLICGWFQSQELSVMKLNGPWYEGIPADVRADPGKGSSEYWVRKATAR
jgi:hypothetical protein